MQIHRLPCLPLGAALAMLTASSAASAQSPGDFRLGVAAPLAGPEEILGRQLLAGAQAGSGSADSLVEGDTRCSADGGREAADRFVREKVEVVVGFLCSAALEAALPVLKQASIPVIDVGVRADRFMKLRKDGVSLWRIAPGSSAEADAIATYVAQEWSGVPFALIEDGSPYGRDLADEVRQQLEDRGLQPSLIDNFRPAEEKQFGLARRVQQSGVTRLLVFGSRPDIAIIARDAEELGLQLDIVGGESLLDEASAGAPLPSGVIAIASGPDVAWTPSETKPPLEGYAYSSQAAAEIAIEAIERARGSGRSISSVLGQDRFQTSLGEVRFDSTGSSAFIVFRPYRWDGNRFVPLPER